MERLEDLVEDVELVVTAAEELMASLVAMTDGSPHLLTALTRHGVTGYGRDLARAIEILRQGRCRGFPACGEPLG